MENGDAPTVSQEPEPPFLYGSLITVIVGLEKACFSIHKERVCDRSDFFRAACNGHFKEAEGVVTLPEQEPPTFKHFIHWLYTEKIRGYFYPESIDPSIQVLKMKVLSAMGIKCLNDRHLKCGEFGQEALDRANHQDLPFTALISLYILADSLLVRGLKDQIITLLVEVYGYSRLENRPKGISLGFWNQKLPGRMTGLPSPTIGINLAWKKTPENCHLRQVLLKLFCENASTEIYVKEPYDPEFLSEAVCMIAGMWIGNDGTTDWAAKGGICRYHVHDVKCRLENGVGEGDE